MSLHKSRKSACVPANIYCEHTYNRYHEEGLRLLEKYLPYLNPETGLRNRMITRDPVTGLGELEAEWNPLNGCHLRRRHFPHRDPIRMEGDMGTEYNCLYTTKELTCKERVNRDPITLQGDLGEEINIFRPHGGRPRHRNEHDTNVLRSDSINNRNEHSPGNNYVCQNNGGQYNGENSRRNSYLATDPITHSLPESKLVRSQSVRHYKEAWVTRDPIGYMHRASISYKTDKTRGMKHFPNNKISTDPITHQQKKSPSNQMSSGVNDETSTISDLNEAPLFSTSAVTENKLRRALRNPITGEGMFDSDYIDLLKIPSEYYFRRHRDTLSSTMNETPQASQPSTTSTTSPAAVPSKKVPAQKDTKSVNKPATNKSKHQTPPPPSQQPSKLEPKVEKHTPQAIEKKVIRPKKIEVPEETKQSSAEEQAATEERKSVRTVIQSQPNTKTQVSTKDDAQKTQGNTMKQQTSEAVKPQTPEIVRPGLLKEATKSHMSDVTVKPQMSEETLKPMTSEGTVKLTSHNEETKTPKETTEPQTTGETIKPQTPDETIKPRTPDETIKPQTPDETIKPRTPNETIKPQTPDETIKPRTPNETIKPQTPDETIKPQTPDETIKPQTPDETIKPQTQDETIRPQTLEGTVKPYVPEETVETPTGHISPQLNSETKSTEKYARQSLGEELRLAMGELEPMHPDTELSINDKVLGEVSENKSPQAVSIESSPVIETKLSVDTTQQSDETKISEDDLKLKPPAELPKTGQL
ncbi:sodium-dependent glucose transporter 1 isoform 2 [Schistosoma japonicum]|uniref:Sodium-dependent glucose transporter 1 isoform 2 n=2 Tax=Schistosoma japonicum TaxID=6182 RepID=A0A4Z2DGE5_SCHJA|nr:sodium-dependent glucose transporter 1 isoform 2 [Schistosoma japonicum]